MARTVSVSELKTHLSRYLRLVRHGEIVLICDRDRIVARMEGAGPGVHHPDDERLARLEGTGVLRRGHRVNRALLARRIHASARVVSALLAEREEGR